MVFKEFTEMVNGLAPETIINSLDLQCDTLEQDFQQRHAALDDDALSILCFRQFIRMARKGVVMACAKHLPPDHLDFYRKTIARLVHANELRASALEQFEEAFSPQPPSDTETKTKEES
jgi:hypothetical protein